MTISISASNLNPQVEELVEIYISRSIPENVGVWAYVNGVEKASWTVPPDGNLIIRPSMLGTSITFNAEGLFSHERSNTLILTVQVSPQPPTSLGLSASKTNNVLPSEIVTFTVTAYPPVSWRVTLKGFSPTGQELGTWDMGVFNGTGTRDLVPSVIGTSIWQAYTSEGLSSNCVGVGVNEPAPFVPTCPTGYHWNVATNSCVIDTPWGPSTNMWIVIGGISIVAVIGAILLLRKH